MTTRVLAALPLLLLGLGCVEQQQRSLLVPPGSTVAPQFTSLRPGPLGPRVPEHEATARRLLAVGHKLLDANKESGLHPAFIPVGFPPPEISHTGGGTTGY